ncbi:MAG TPA: sigma-70 family RNA polymerase sigma factor [Candidatus Thermoplasmatota archaeon]
MTPDPLVDAYFKDAARRPLLTAKKERLLAWRIQVREDKDALRHLVESNLRLVVFFAKQYRGKGLAFQDLIQEGNLGLEKAARRFDPDRGWRFQTYAKYWVRDSIQRAIQEKGRTVRVPVTHLETVARAGRARRALRNESSKDPTLGAVARRAKIRKARVEAALESTRPDTYALDPESPVTVEYRSLDQQVEDAQERAVVQRHLDALPDLLAQLPPRARRVVLLRHGLGEVRRELSLAAIARKVGVTTWVVRTTYRAAIARLRGTLRRQNWQ